MELSTVLTLLAVIAAWYVISRFVLPRLGVRT
jgi:p-aminobenzoyl-glutamate transporter AbgT